MTTRRNRERYNEAGNAKGDLAFISIRSVVNNAMIRRELRNGREVIIAPAKCMRDDDVLNGIMYPAEELRDAYWTLEQTQVPLGHTVDSAGRLIPAASPAGLAAHYIGAHSENVRRVPDDDGSGKSRIHSDIVIDVQRAKSTNGGKKVLDAINKGDPISTSTGLTGRLETAPESAPYSHIVRFIDFDHNAILLNEEPASSTKEGTGIFVNSSDEVFNVRQMIANIDQSEEKNEEADPAIEGINSEQAKGLFKQFLNWMNGKQETGENAKTRGTPKMDEELKKEFSKLNSRLDEAEQSRMTSDKIEEIVNKAIDEKVKPVIEEVEAASNERKEREAAEKAELVDKVVALNELPKEAAEASPNAVLRALVNKHENKSEDKAAAIGNNGNQGAGQDAKAGASDLQSKLNQKANAKHKETE